MTKANVMKTIVMGEITRILDTNLSDKEINVFGKVTVLRRYSNGDRTGSCQAATEGMINAFMQQYDGVYRQYTSQDYKLVFDCYPR